MYMYVLEETYKTVKILISISLIKVSNSKVNY